MLGKIIGSAMRTAMQKKLQGGPMSMLPLSPMKGSGTPAAKGTAVSTISRYTGRQNPRFAPAGGRPGIPRPMRSVSGATAPQTGARPGGQPKPLGLGPVQAGGKKLGLGG